MPLDGCALSQPIPIPVTTERNPPGIAFWTSSRLILVILDPAAAGDTAVQNRFLLSYYSPVTSHILYILDPAVAGDTPCAEPFSLVLLFTSHQSPVTSHILSILDIHTREFR